MSAFDDFLADPGEARQWLLELDVLSLDPISDGTQASAADAEHADSEVSDSEGDGNETGGLSTLYYSSHGFTSRSSDTPASTWYDGRIGAEVTIERRIYGRDGIAGLARVFGEVVLRNDDGELDDLLDNYALDGRAARFYVGRPTDARADHGLIFSAIVQDVPTVGLKQFRLRLSDGLARLDVPLQPTNYAGTGGLEGGTDLKGKPKPKCYGNAKNVSAPLVDSTRLIYQVNDGEISDVPVVKDRGVVLTQGADYSSQSDLENNAPSAGQYRVWKAGGYFRLGATPDGTVTADVLGDALGGYVNKHADIVQRILLNQVGMDSAELDAAAFTQLNTDQAAEAGIWIGTEERQAGEVVDQLLASAGAFGGFTRLGKFSVARIAAATGAAVASYSGQEIGDIERVPLPAAVGPFVWRARVAWQRNYTVQTDLASSVTAATRTFAAEPERVANAEDVSVKSQRPLAKPYGPTGDLYAAEAAATTEAQRRLDLWSAQRKLFRVPLPAIALHRDLGEVVNLTHTRHGLGAGADGRVLGHAVRGMKAELMVLV